MLLTTAPPHQRPTPRVRPEALSFRLSPIAAIVASMTMLASGALHAADPTIAELQAENARLRQIIAGQSGAAPAAAPATPASAVANASAAAAEKEEPQTLGEVTIRSRNRLERLQDVPLSVSVVTGAELDRLNASDLGEITKRAANISWNQGNQRTSSLSIRGLGKVGQTEAQDPSVGIIVDGVNYAYNPLTSSFDFTDVDAVEVTRGPQGTLLGKNTSLGVVNITTRRPSFKPSADYSIIFGQHGKVTARAAAGGPIVDELLAWRGAFSVDKGPGPLVNRYNPDSTYQNKDRVSGRAQFLLTPSRDFNARLSIDVQPRAGENTNGGTLYTPTPARFANGATNTLSTDASAKLGRRWFSQLGSYNYQDGYLNQNGVYNDAQQPVVTGSNGVSAELNWNLGSHTLTSISAYKDYRFNAHNNDEGTPFDINRSSGQEIDYSQKSQEIRLSSQTGGFVDYQTGLFFMNTHTDIRRNVIYGADAGAWYASEAQYTRLDANSNGRYLMQNSLDKVWKNENQQTVANKSQAIYAQANWHLSEPLTLTTGLRFTRENRQNPGSSLVSNYGNAAELNPVAVNGVQLGGFSSNSTGGLNAGNSAAQLALADTVALKYFGIANYSLLSAAQQRQVADAKAIRQTRLGVLWNTATPEPFKDVQPAFVLSPSYKINDDLTTYASWQYGEKAGISQQVNGLSYRAEAEKTNSFELGLKSALLNRTLIINTDIYLSNIRNYQQSAQVFDGYTTGLNNNGTLYYTAATGNVPKVRARGLEIDGAYSGIRNATLRFAGAYNNANYKDFKNSAQPVENGNLTAPYRDVSGQTVAGAPKYAFNIGGDYRLPLGANREFHTSFNTAYTSKFNSDNALSEYGWIPAKYITDFAVGVGAINRSFDVSVLVKNLFNDAAPLARTWNSYTPAVPRQVGVMLSGKL